MIRRNFSQHLLSIKPNVQPAIQPKYSALASEASLFNNWAAKLGTVFLPRYCIDRGWCYLLWSFITLYWCVVGSTSPLGNDSFVDVPTGNTQWPWRHGFTSFASLIGTRSLRGFKKAGCWVTRVAVIVDSIFNNVYVGHLTYSINNCNIVDAVYNKVLVIWLHIYSN